MAIWIRFPNEGEVEADEEIAEMVKFRYIEPTGSPEWYLVLLPHSLGLELKDLYDYDIISCDNGDTP